MKGNQAPAQKFERPNQKILKSKLFLTSVKNWGPPLESSMKRFLQRLGLNKNKSKQIKINDIIYCFTSKAYSAAMRHSDQAKIHYLPIKYFKDGASQ